MTAASASSPGMARKNCTHKEDAEEAGQWRPYQSMMRINPAQGAHEHETGNQQHDAGNKERRAQAEEEQLLAREAQARESIARHRCHQQDTGGAQSRHIEAVENPTKNRQLLSRQFRVYDLVEIVQCRLGRDNLDGPLQDSLLMHERLSDNPNHGKQHNEQQYRQK